MNFTQEDLDRVLNKFNESEWAKMSTHELNRKDANWAKNDYLVFKPEKIKQLAKNFTNSQQMIDYKGENKNQINAAGRYIQYKKVERPEWFESIYEGESKKECLQINTVL